MKQKSKSDRVFNVKKQNAPAAAANAPANGASKVVNPFDRKTNRVKHSVLGKKVIGTSGNRGQSRYNDIERRKKTLLVEMNLANKSNQFNDSRFEETNTAMSEEDKMLARFQKEKMRNKSLYNLNDNDDEQLTHYGMALGNHMADDYEADEDDELLEEEKMVGRRHSSSEQDNVGADGMPMEKTRDEIYKEIIEKSKQGRADRAKEKMAKEDMTRQLDEDFDDIRSSNVLIERRKVEGDPLLSLFPSEQQKQDQQNQQQQSGIFASNNNSNNPYDDYESLVMELANDVKAKATDRMKTPEELMKEENERLEKLEEDRLKRMRGEIVEDDVAPKKQTRWAKRQEKLTKDKVNKPTRPTADDLNDEDFAMDLGNESAPWYNDGEAAKNDEEDGEDSDEEEGDEDEDDEEAEAEEDDEDADLDDSEDDENAEDDDEEDDEDDLEEQRLERELKKLQTQKKASEEIPFTFDVPKSVDELNQWLAGRNQEEKELVYTRIRVCNHISLKPQNKEKMKVYLPVLWRRFELIAIGHNTLGGLDWKELDLLSRYIFEVGKDVPDILASTALAMLESCYRRSMSRVDKASDMVSAWPSVSEMLTMKLIGNIFPTSDYSHPVITPTTVVMAHCITQCPIKSGHDIISSLFLSTVFQFYLKSANKYSPELSAMLLSLLSVFVEHQKKPVAAAALATKGASKNASKTETKLAPAQSNVMDTHWTTFKSSIFVPTIMLRDGALTITNKGKKLSTMEPSKEFDFAKLTQSKQDDVLKQYYESDQFRVDLLYLLLSMTRQYVEQGNKSDQRQSLPSVFTLFLGLLKAIDAKDFHPTIKEKLNHVIETITNRIASIVDERVPLTLQEFHEHGDDPDAVRQETKKLKALHKKETKGAIRELMKDNTFIQQEKSKKRAIERQEIEASRKKIMSELEQEQSEAKQFKKLKDRLDGRI
ncbi:hypothetical protein SAMD00019534_083440 [Acytostelium subglobosum LB1]|uniref:hypothetical protein n=1 Tax=Acytostelium subglobosum LB1 TaxID=1410327 RepID=UPI000644C621|nr:hypothetical protein SAMD00019534_083440 [Acytostelium subglobosum LB1]GAM25169.1 hypothetical protein SAMD00019534_083440 [Acytostelium subglobosum LB1]|eukprot:XP_012751689.1 hypothetical protein SAMD00019534_083440 [Acytostelium subglobosum LB1]